MEDKKEKEILKSIPEFYFGVNFYDEQEENEVSEVIRHKAPFRYYGNDLMYQVQKYENTCKEYYNVKYAYAVNSGTGALACALHALDVGVGDKVIVPGFFWISVSNTLLLRGAIPVFCEVDDSFNMDIEDLKNKIDDKTKCVIAIHMEGVQCRIDEISKICKDKGVYLLEDFSQCNGGSFGNRKIGSFGDVSISSLQLNKIVSCGEGGILLTNSETFYQKIVARADCGFYSRVSDGESQIETATYGEGRRFSEISGAIMNMQMKKIDKLIHRMNSNKYQIINYLGDIAPIKLREVHDKAGDTGYSIIFIFQNVEHIELFLSIYNELYGENILRFYRISEMGYHIYYNCSNLVERIEVLPNNFPWAYIENDIDYHEGLLKYTDDLVKRSIAIRLPADLSEEQRTALQCSLKKLIQMFQDALN